MTKDELKNLLINKIKENKGKIPHILTIENEDWQWSGGQRIGNSQLYRYRKVGIYLDKQAPEKQIMLAC